MREPGDWCSADELARELGVDAQPGLTVGRDRALLVVERGDDLELPGVRAADTVEWQGVLVPADTQRILDLPTLVLVRDHDGRLRFLGEAKVSSLGRRRSQAATEIRFWFPEPMSEALLDWARPTADVHGETSLEWLSLVRADRVAAMRAFLEAWEGPLSASDGIDAATLSRYRLPRPLAELHRAIGKRPDLLEHQNSFVPVPELLEPEEDGLMTFYVENQGVFRARIDPRLEDPPVELWDLEPEPIREREPLSGFLLHAVVSEALFRAPYAASAIESDDARGRVIAPLTPVPLEPWHWPGDPCELFVAPSLIAMISQNCGDWDVMIGAKHRQALRYLRELEIDWTVFDG